MDLSIIVPVYNVEKYVRSCIESIFKQELDEDRFEVIIVFSSKNLTKTDLRSSSSMTERRTVAWKSLKTS